MPVGSRVWYCCDNGSLLTNGQSDVIHCTPTGQWSSNLPHCSSTSLHLVSRGQTPPYGKRVCLNYGARFVSKLFFKEIVSA